LCFEKMGRVNCMEPRPYLIDLNIQVLQLNEPPKPCLADMRQPDSHWQEHLDCKQEIQ
jgi:hypothetical protein